MNALHVRVVKELVTLGPLAEGLAAPIEEAGKHLSPQEFHAGITAQEDAVILDARNLYEHRIGHFKIDGVPSLLPPIRQFSELPAWIDANQVHAQMRISATPHTHLPRLASPECLEHVLPGKA